MVFINRKKLVATESRREGACNRTDEPSVTFCEKEKQGSGRITFFNKKVEAKRTLLRRGRSDGTNTYLPRKLFYQYLVQRTYQK